MLFQFSVSDQTLVGDENPCRFDLAVKKKSREKLCPIRTRAAKKVIKEGVCNEYLHSWDQRKRYKVT